MSKRYIFGKASNTSFAMFIRGNVNALKTFCLISCIALNVFVMNNHIPKYRVFDGARAIHPQIH